MKSILTDLPRETIATVAERADEPAFRGLARDLADPKMMTVSTQGLLARHKISGARFLEIWRDHHAAEALALISPEFPALYRDIADNAKSHQVYCQVCNGTGAARAKTPSLHCPRCKGVGVILEPGDKDSRRLMLEIAGLIGKKGPTVAIQQNFSQPTVSVEDTSATVGKILEGTSEPIEGETSA